MNQGLVIFMLLGIVGGLAAAVTALFLGWGWLVAIVLYCLVGAVTLVTAAAVAVIVVMRPARDASDQRESDAAPDPGLVQVWR